MKIRDMINLVEGGELLGHEEAIVSIIIPKGRALSRSPESRGRTFRKT
jgi:hypothetical protein